MMASIWAMVLQVFLAAIKFWVKDEAKKKQWETDIGKANEQYEREAKTSAEIREDATDTRIRFEERLKVKKP